MLSWITKDPLFYVYILNLLRCDWQFSIILFCILLNEWNEINLIKGGCNQLNNVMLRNLGITASFWRYFDRRVKSLCLESCSLLTTEGLESALLSWKEIQSLKVISCGNIMDSEISPSLSTLFSALKDLQWRPDTKTLLSAGLVGTCMRKRGSKVFKKTCDWKSLPGA